MGKDGTQLLRHCARLLVLVSTDLLAVRLSGIISSSIFSLFATLHMLCKKPYFLMVADRCSKSAYFSYISSKIKLSLKYIFLDLATSPICLS